MLFKYCICADMSVYPYIVVLAALTSAKSKYRKLSLAIGTSVAAICLLAAGFGLFFWRRQRRKQQRFFDVNGMNPSSHPQQQASLVETLN